MCKLSSALIANSRFCRPLMSICHWQLHVLTLSLEWGKKTMAIMSCFVITAWHTQNLAIHYLIFLTDSWWAFGKWQQWSAIVIIQHVFNVFTCLKAAIWLSAWLWHGWPASAWLDRETKCMWAGMSHTICVLNFNTDWGWRGVILIWCHMGKFSKHTHGFMLYLG